MPSHVVGLGQYAGGHPALFAPIEISQVSDARVFAKLRTGFGVLLRGLPSLKGLGFFYYDYPALKRWAKLFRLALRDSGDTRSSILPC
jgi:hypothetical protein